MQPLAYWSLEDSARILAELAAPSPLPSRTVIVPREAMAHPLRRALIAMGRKDLLIGTRFLSPLRASLAVLDGAGIEATASEDALRPMRLLALFRRGELRLRYFGLPLLRETLGWEAAFAHALRDLEDAGLRPEDVPTSLDPRLEDVATIWRAADEGAGSSWTTPRSILEAARLLEGDPSRWPFAGPTLALVTEAGSAVTTRLLRAIPRATLAFSVPRPFSAPHLDRPSLPDGAPLLDALQRAEAPPLPVHSTERDLLQRYLFAPDASPDRARSQGPDGTVSLEEYAGTDAEIEAAAEWVARQVLDKGVPLDRIAVLAPSQEPLLSLLADRLEQLFQGEAPIPIHLAGGRPFASSFARALAVVRALRNDLDLASFVDVIQLLRDVEVGGRQKGRLSRQEAIEIASQLGTAGGYPGEPEGALTWSKRLVEKRDELRALVMKDDADSRIGRARRRLLASVEAIHPAVEALSEIAARKLDGGSLAEITARLSSFSEAWLVSPRRFEPTLAALIEGALSPLATDATCSALSGDDAMRAIEETLEALRLSEPLSRTPSVYLGSIASASGLRFRAVRILGLCEGALPSLPREDPVLPERLRRQFPLPLAPRLRSEAVVEQLRALHYVIREVEDEIAFSFARADENGTQREPSSVFLDIASALARPNAETGEPASPVPHLRGLERDGFAPARRALEEYRQSSPSSSRAFCERLARGSERIPSRWQAGGALDLHRLRTLASDEQLALEIGPLEDTGAQDIPGLRGERPISPTSLRALFECPHRFLLTNQLRMGERAEAPTGREIDALSYGSLFHEIAESFSRAHGAEFGERARKLEAWQRLGDGVVDTVFDAFLTSYPLVGEGLVSQQRERLKTSFRRFLEYDWNQGKPREYFATEWAFGVDSPVALEAGERLLYVRGTIDRIDHEDGRTLVRDLKTGRCYPREEEEPNPERDIQIAVYGLVLKKLAREHGLPSRVGVAYAHIDERSEPERAFVDDFDLLEERARGWLEVGARLLEERVFPRTPRSSDCTYCAFRVVCGDDAAERSAAILSGATGTLADFRDLKEGSSQ